MPEAAVGAVRATLREHGEAVAARGTTCMQARTADEVPKALRRDPLPAGARAPIRCCWCQSIASIGTNGSSRPKLCGPKTASASRVRMIGGTATAMTLTRWP